MYSSTSRKKNKNKNDLGKVINDKSKYNINAHDAIMKLLKDILILVKVACRNKICLKSTSSFNRFVT